MPNPPKGEVPFAKECSRLPEELTRALPLSENDLPIRANGDEFTGVVLFQWLPVFLVKAIVLLTPLLPTFLQAGHWSAASSASDGLDENLLIMDSAVPL